MRIIVFRYFQFLSILLLGVILGASLMNFLIGKKIDQLHLKNSELLSEVSDKELEIKELEKSLKSLEGKKIKVKSVSISISLEKDDEFTELELEKTVKEMLLPIIGRELKELDPLTIPDIIHKRRVLIEKDEYLLEVKNTLIAEEVVMHINAKKLISPN